MFTASCKKSVTPSPDPVQNSDVDVYLAGDVIATNGKNVATYWKNGIAVRLADSLSNSRCNSMIVQGNDVYIAGAILGTDDDVAHYYFGAAYWKNGVVTQLDKGPNYSEAFGITLVGKDIYVGGNTSDDALLPFATYWKNGVETKLPAPYPGSDVYAVGSNGTDVIFAGDTRYNDNYAYRATYWKTTGSPVPLADDGNGAAYAVAMSGNDVYTCGYVGSNAFYWKNSTSNLLSNLSSTRVNGIGISGQDVYVVGSTIFNGRNVATYWKNGVPTRIGDGLSDSSAYGVAFNATDIYISGYTYDTQGRQIATYWKNGVAKQLTQISKGSRAFSIAVVKH